MVTFSYRPRIVGYKEEENRKMNGPELNSVVIVNCPEYKTI